jgi:hypothetical protein
MVCLPLEVFVVLGNSGIRHLRACFPLSEDLIPDGHTRASDGSHGDGCNLRGAHASKTGDTKRRAREKLKQKSSGRLVAHLVGGEAHKLPIIILHIEIAEHETEYCSHRDGAGENGVDLRGRRHDGARFALGAVGLDWGAAAGVDCVHDTE